MKRFYVFMLIALLSSSFVHGQRVDNFMLEDVLTGQNFELDKYEDAKAVVLIFNTLSCPFSKLYENRIIELHENFKADGFVFAIVNPHFGNDPDENKQEVEERFKGRVQGLPILNDGNQNVTRQLQATKLPEVVVITPSPTGFAIAYRGAIDNNPQVPESANMRYLVSAIQSIQNKRNPSPSSSRPVGCNIRMK